MNSKSTCMLRLWPVLIVAGAGLLFMLHIGGYDVWAPDEPRFAQVAREMMQSGDYLAPHVNGLPYYEKPPLLFWLIALASWPAGDVTELTARAPSVLAALTTLLCTYLLAARLFSTRVALWSIIILATTARYWWQARTVQIDMLLTACLTAALLFFWHWHESRRTRWLILFYAGIAAAVYAKGPPGIVFPLLLIVTFYWRRPEDRKATHWIAATVVVALLIFAWLIPARMAVGPETIAATDGGIEHLESGVAANLFRQTVGRMFLGVSKAQWPWYYLTTIPVDLLPWSLFLPWTLHWIWNHRRDGEAVRFMLCYTVPALIFFSISVGKRAIYILPLFPVFAIFLALSVLDLTSRDAGRYRRIVAAVWGAAIILLAAAPLVVKASEYADLYTPRLWLFAAAAVIGGVVMLMGVGPWNKKIHVLLAATFAALATVAALIVFPVVNQVKSARYICEPVRTLADAGVAIELYSVGFSREEYVFYSRQFHTPVLTSLLPLPLLPHMDAVAMAREQRELRKEMTDAVEDVLLVSDIRPTPEELEALREAMHAAVENARVDPALAAAFEEALRVEVESFVRAFETGGPAFAFIQQRDWRWLVVLYPHLLDFQVIESREVGRRDVFLLANAAGAQQVQAHARAASEPQSQ
jgi:4-amino-4-deoxy-L-arabinose transferase-like glycosyltransferase